MFFEIFTIAAWGIWKERNNKHFRGIPPTHASWLARFKADLGLMKHRTKEGLWPFIDLFVSNIT